MILKSPGGFGGHFSPYRVQVALWLRHFSDKASVTYLIHNSNYRQIMLLVWFGVRGIVSHLMDNADKNPHFGGVENYASTLVVSFRWYFWIAGHQETFAMLRKCFTTTDAELTLIGFYWHNAPAHYIKFLFFCMCQEEVLQCLYLYCLSFLAWRKMKEISLFKHSVYVNKMCFALSVGGVFIQRPFYLNSFQLHGKL